MSLSLRSPAKLNLYLRVLRKRPDGFHEIKTIFQRISLYDTITFSSNTSGQIKISCAHPHVPVGPKNLVYKVANLLREKFCISHGVNIRIQKRIPVAAGLAGGSTNAATAILGLNKLWKLQLSKPKMCNIARKIGSDVAFFLHDTSWALGTSRGDVIRPLKLTAELWQVVVVPKIKMYSGEIYQGLKMQLTKGSDDANILIHHLQKSDVLGVSRLLANDLDAVAVRLCPSLKKLKNKLKSLGAQGVMVSGSGPSVFGVTESKNTAMTIARTLRKRYSQVFVVKTL